MTYNSAMFRRIYDQITQHPETHNQALWENPLKSCGTTRCIAGWAIAFEYGVGERDSIHEVPEVDRVDSRLVAMGPALPQISLGGVARLPGVAIAAAQILGLSDEEACELFYATGEGAVEKCLYYANKGD